MLQRFTMDNGTHVIIPSRDFNLIYIFNRGGIQVRKFLSIAETQDDQWINVQANGHK